MALAARETAELRLECEQAGYSLARWIEEVAAWPGGHPDGAGPWSDDAASDAGSARAVAIAGLAAAIGSPLAAPVGWALACASMGLSAREAVTAFLWSFT